MNNLNQNSFICTKKILFLGYGKEKTKIISALKKYNCKVKHKSTKVVLSDLDDIDLVISYGYRHILKSSFINHKDIPIIKIYAFEPQKNIFDYLKNKFSKNKRFILRNCAISNKNGFKKT